PERHPTADRKTVQDVRHLEAIRVVERDGPECASWRRGALLEVNDVLVRSVQRLAGFVGEIQGVDGVLRQVRAEAKLRHDGTLQVVVPIYAHGIRSEERRV